MTNLRGEPVAQSTGPELEPASEVVASGAGDPESLVGRELASGRFRVLRKLGAGGMGVVYEAYDQERDQNVALKQIVRSYEPSGRALKHEFRSLADLQHRNVVRLHELFCEAEPWFFTMDLIQGGDFVRHVRGGAAAASRTTVRQAGLVSPASDADCAAQVSAARLRDALIGLTEGLTAIHSAGKLHCDIKPSNVAVTEEGRAVILDFGLVTGSAIDPWRPHLKLAGTPGYIAPERFAGGAPTEACDWYGVGAMLCEAMTGQLPDPGSALRRPVTAWDDASLLDGELVRALQEACLGLLRADPRERWDGHALLDLLGTKAGGRRSSTPPAGGPAELLVGRDAELGTLRELVGEAQRGRSVVALIHGESGIGKSALIGRFAAEMRGVPRAVVLQSRCYERESVPYKTLDGLVDQLAAYWGHLPATDAAALLPRDAGSLLQVFAALRTVPALVAEARRHVAEAKDPRERRASAFRALQEVLARVADRATLIIAVDDLQWGDIESATDLIQLVTGDAAPAALLIAAYRSADAQQSLWFERLPELLARSATAFREIDLPPLGQSDVAQLAEALSDQPLSPVALSSIADGSRGNPFFVREFVRQTLRDGSPDISVQSLIQLRIDHLSDAERALLELISISPAPVKRRVLRDASGLGSQFEAAIGELLANSFVRSRRGRAYDLLEPYHDRIREHVCALLPAETQRRHHCAFAAVLRRESTAPAEIIAAHLEGADLRSEASRLYGIAAAEARRALAFGHAAAMLQKSLELSAFDGTSVDAGRLLELAEVASLAGQGPRAAHAYQAAAEVCADVGQRATLKLRAAEQLLFAGHFDPALGLLREVLPGFGIRVPDWPRWRLTLHLLFNAVRVLFTWRARLKTAPTAALRARICATLGDALLYLHFGMSGYFYQQHVIQGFRAGEPTRLALALTSRALLVTSPYPHRLRDVVADLERAREIASVCGEPLVHGQVMLNEAVVHSAAGRYAETLELARQAELIFRRDCQGVTSGLTHAIAWQSVSLFYLGRFNELRELCRDNLLEAQRRGDQMLSKLLGIWSAWAALARDQPDEALRLAPELRFDRQFTVLDAGVLAQRTLLLLYRGQAEEAWTTHHRCAGLVRQAGVLTARARAYEFYWTRGLIASHLICTPAAPEAARRRLRADIRTLTWTQSAEAHAMAEHLAGNLCAASGQTTAAIAKWKMAARLYDTCNMRALAATLAFAASRVDDKDVARETALTALAACGVRNPEHWTSTWCPSVPGTASTAA